MVRRNRFHSFQAGYHAVQISMPGKFLATIDLNNSSHLSKLHADCSWHRVKFTPRYWKLAPYLFVVNELQLPTIQKKIGLNYDFVHS
jgi:hypothetical protein